MLDITYLGHSAVRIKGTKTVFIDPFLSGNPKAALAPEEITAADVVVVTHDHADHLGDAFSIAKRTGAVLVAMHETAVEAGSLGIASEGMNIGGTVEARGIKVHMVPALHSAGKGNAAGVVVEIEGKRIYHAGDTGLTYDLKLVGEFFHPDLSFIPIGDRYTMGPASAAKAVEFIKTKKVVPVHYGTFPLIAADPQEFKRLVGAAAEVLVLKPGETIRL